MFKLVQDKLCQYCVGNCLQEIVQVKVSLEQVQVVLVQVKLDLYDIVFIVFFDGMLMICVVEFGIMFNVGGIVLILLLMYLVWVCVYVDEKNFGQVQLG